MRTRGRNRLVIEQDGDEDVRPYTEHLMDGQNHSATQPYIEQLMDNQNSSEDQAHDDQFCDLNSPAGGIEVQQNDDESGNLEPKKVRGPTLLKDIWKLPPGKVVDVPFNNRNQAIGEKGRKLASFLGIIARTPELTPLHVGDWRNFDKEEKKKLRRFQANRNNRANQKMPHTGGSKSIATLMDEQAVNGIEPTRAQVFILTHTKRKDGRPLDDDSVKAIEMINERTNNSESSTDQPPRAVAWEGDVYSQVFRNDKSGYVRGLGLGPTPSILWVSRSYLENIVGDDSSNEAVQRLTQEITELKDKHNEEINLMKQNQEKMQSELLEMRQLMRKYASNESMPQNINGTSIE
ncbi:PREDICTED: uncharacterized protein LOC109233611 [Nicotiana attenuata]|uniref:uncharacterized protein LOC109233611 n=1 Tax=Nicotiana attenuata TaxID=49451 RepID=UPI000904BC44|nr:PREDICTED: uncharacterized protein LOC109233611 [Nicotiana attenuata]